MNTQPTTQNAPVAATPAARLGASHGYRFDGDSVFLNASFHAASDADTGLSWSLRLVATGTAPTDASTLLAAHIVTEVPLPPLAELTGAVDDFETVSAALAPSGRGYHTLSLALVGRDGLGRVTLHDHVTYPLAQSFLQPRLTGPVGCWFETDTELVLDLDHVENTRASDNLSGTLSLEVWALDTAYAGGRFDGQPVAGAILGRIAGGDSWQPGALHLHATRPTKPRAHLVVMLREWNGVAYVTRDHVSFTPAPLPATVPAPAAVLAPAPSVTIAPPVETPAPITPTATSAPARKTAKSASAAKTPATKTAPARIDARVSINTATVTELTKIKGLSPALATALIAARPLARVEDLRLVKGFTPKTYEKLHTALKV